MPAPIAEDDLIAENEDNQPVDENRPLTAREVAMNAIQSRREGDIEEEMQEANGDQQQQIEQQLEAEPAPQVLTDGLDKVKVKVKIDGAEGEVTVEEMVRQYQKNGTADRRLAEATRLLEQARAQAAAPQPAAAPPVGIVENTPKNDISATPSGAVDAQGGKEFLAALFDGDEDRALAALGQLVGGRQAPTLDEAELAARLTPQIRQQLVVDSALEKFKVDFADVMADPHLEQVAADFTQAAMEEGMPFADALVEGGKKTRDWLAAKAPKPAPSPTPTMDRNSKLERKAQMDNVQALSRTATTTQEAPQTASDVIAEMRKARGMA